MAMQVIKKSGLADKGCGHPIHTCFCPYGSGPPHGEQQEVISTDELLLSPVIV